MQNYQVGGALSPNTPYYVKRKADLDLHQSLIKGDFCYVFNARQMGKTSLQFQVSKQLQENGYKVVNLDLAGIGITLTIQQWYATLLSKISRSLNLDFNLLDWWEKQELLSFSSKWEAFLKDIVLEQVRENIIIFIDEIDTVNNLDFSTDDFFASIRACYNNRGTNKKFNRLTFCLLGVTRPSYLIKDKQRTPFNIGKAIELKGFTFEEAEKPLGKGLKIYCDNSQQLLKDILSWTGGQPFLTIKICQLVINQSQAIPKHKINIGQLVQDKIINNWRSNDDPIHLQIIENRIIHNSQSIIDLLILYQKNLQKKEIISQDTSQEYELRLSGLVIKNNGYLQIYNKIYRTIFDETWIADKIHQQLLTIRPNFYINAFQKWVTSKKNQSKYLLSPQQLKEFEEWANKGQELTKKDLEFLHASIKKHERAARNKTIKLQFIFASLLIGLISGFLGIQWYQFQQQYQQKIAQNLILFSQKTKENNRQKRILLQLEALRLHPSLPIPLNFYRDLAKIPKIQQIFTHNDQVNDMEVSPDGQMILTGSLDGNAYLWQINGKLINQFNHDGHSVNSVAFSADGNYFATASIDGTVKVWRKNWGVSHFDKRITKSNDRPKVSPPLKKANVQNYNAPKNVKLIRTFKHDNSVNKIIFSPNSNYMATVSADSQLKLLNFNTGKIMSLLHKGNIISLAFSATHPYLITGSLDKTARVWNVETGENIKTIEHQQGVNQVVFSHDGKFTITGSSDGIVKIINLDSQENYQLEHSHAVLNLSVSYDHKKLVTVTENVAKIWNLEDILNFKHKILTENDSAKEFIHEKKINKAIFTANNQHLITVADDFQARVWKIDSDNNLSSQIFHDAPVVDVETVNPHSLLTASWDKTVRLWNILPNNEIEVISFPFTIIKSNLTPDHRYLSILDKNNKVRGINLENSQLLNSNIITNKDNKIIWSSQGNYLAIVENEIVEIWQKSDKNLYKLITILPHIDEVHYLEFSPDEKYLVTASDDWKTRLWQLKKQIKMDDGKIIFEKYADHLKFSPDSNFLVISSQNNRGFIFDMTKEAFIKDGNGQAQKFLLEMLKFSPDSKLLLTFANGSICFNHSQNFSQQECQVFLDKTTENFQNNQGGFINIKDEKFIENINEKEQEFLSEILEFTPNHQSSIKSIICFHNEQNLNQQECQYVSDETIDNIQWIETSEYLGIMHNKTKLTLGKINNIQQSKEYKFQKIVNLSFENEIKAFDISPNGEYLAIVTQDDNIELRNIRQPSKVLLIIEAEEPIKAIKIAKQRNSLRLNVITSKDIVQVPLWNRQTLLNEKACRILNHNFTEKEWEMLIEEPGYRSTCLSD